MKFMVALMALMACASSNAGWRYESEADKMTGGKSVEAQVTSDSELFFDFPYKGNNWGFLTVRQHPKYGLDVIVSITKGQMLCHRDCAVSVKFDNAKAVTYSGTGPSDHSSTAILLDNAPRFIASAKKAKKILIQFTAFHNGVPVLEFSTPQALEWPRK
jgi:hypothetical protein